MTLCRSQPKGRILSHTLFNTQQNFPIDGGAIYLLGEQPGGRIESNYIHSTTRLIYPDEGSAGWTIRNNVLAPQPGGTWLLIWSGYCHDMSICNNYTTSPYLENNGVNCAPTETYVEAPLGADAQVIINASGLEPAYANILPGPPSLSCALQNGEFQLSWRSEFLGWRLQTRTTSLGPNWSDVPNSSASTAASFPVASTNASAFYRLVYP